MGSAYSGVEAGCRALRAALDDVRGRFDRQWADGFITGEVELIERELAAAPDRVLQAADVAACQRLAAALHEVAARLREVRAPASHLAPSLEQEDLILTEDDRAAIRRFYEISRRG